MKNNVTNRLKQILLLLLCAFGTTSCILSKESRVLRKNTQDWRAAQVVLEGYSDAPLSGTFLTLRDNGKFEHESSGIFRSFEAGNWTIQQDTITLLYVDADEALAGEKRAVLDRTTSTLVFEGQETYYPLRIRILVNRL